MDEKKEIEEYVKKLKEIEDKLNNLDEDHDYNDDEFFETLENLNDIQETLKSFEKPIKPKFLSDINVKVKRTRDDAVVPFYSIENNTALDLTITNIISETNKEITYGYGLAFEIPEGYVGLIFCKSSIKNYDLTLSNCVSIIHSGNKDEVTTTFNKYLMENINMYKIGDKPVQLLIIPYPKIKLKLVN